MSVLEEWKEAHPRTGWKLVREEAEPLLADIAWLEKDKARLERELQTALDNTDHWIAEVANRGKVVQEQADKIRRLNDDLIHVDGSMHRASVALEAADTERAVAERRHSWVECPECESTSIRCHMCGFTSDGPAFLHEEDGS